MLAVGERSAPQIAPHLPLSILRLQKPYAIKSVALCPSMSHTLNGCTALYDMHLLSFVWQSIHSKIPSLSLVRAHSSSPKSISSSQPQSRSSSHLTSPRLVSFHLISYLKQSFASFASLVRSFVHPFRIYFPSPSVSSDHTAAVSQSDPHAS